MTNTDTTTKAPRPRVTERDYLMPDGEIAKSILEAVGFRIAVIGGETFSSSDIDADFTAEVRRAAALFGIVTVATNAAGGMKGAEASEAIGSRLETLLAGEWADRKGETGPRLSLLAEALVRAKAKAGIEKTIEEAKAFLLSQDEAGRKSIADTPEVKAEYKAIQAERATKAAAEAAAAIKTDGPSGVASIDF